MRRRLFNLAAATSLVLCAATMTLWVMSYCGKDGFIRYRRSPGGSSSNSITQYRGRLLWWYDFPPPKPRMFPDRRPPIFAATQTSTHWKRYRIPPAAYDGGVLGFHWESGREDGPGDWLGDDGPAYWEVTVPHWSVAILFAVMPTVAMLRWRRRARFARGRCRTCGYDLRATPERCPERGTAVDAVAASPPCPSPSAGRSL